MKILGLMSVMLWLGVAWCEATEGRQRAERGAGADANDRWSRTTLPEWANAIFSRGDRPVVAIGGIGAENAGVERRALEKASPCDGAGRRRGISGFWRDEVTPAAVQVACVHPERGPPADA